MGNTALGPLKLTMVCAVDVWWRQPLRVITQLQASISITDTFKKETRKESKQERVIVWPFKSRSFFFTPSVHKYRG